MRRLFRRIRRAPKKVTIPILILVIALIPFVGYQALQVYLYTQMDPEFCRSCHIMDEAWDRWETSEHRIIDCHACHSAGVIQSIKHLTESILGKKVVSTHATVSDETCVKCHESGSPRWIQVAATEGHVIHNEQQNVGCVTCHAQTVHRFMPEESVCGQCHEDRGLPAQEMGGEVHCLSCHEFLAEAETLLPTRKSCLACHQAQAEKFDVTWPAGAPMQYPCQDCHQPHQQAEPIVDCLSCHPTVTTFGLHNNPPHGIPACQTCHQPHAWEMTERQDCLQCHPDRAEHYPNTFCGDCHSFR